MLFKPIIAGPYGKLPNMVNRPFRVKKWARKMLNMFLVVELRDTSKKASVFIIIFKKTSFQKVLNDFLFDHRKYGTGITFYQAVAGV